MSIQSFIALFTSLLFAVNCAVADDGAPPLQDRVGGVGLNVSDMDRSLDYYTRVLGMKAVVKVPNKDGGLLEVAMNMSGSLNDAFVVLASGVDLGRGAARSSDGGNTGFGRVILNVVDARALAHRISAAGFEVERLDAGGETGPVVFVAKDPDGYMLELFQFPEPGSMPDYLPEQ
jgi:lactoylglutathione lyase